MQLSLVVTVRMEELVRQPAQVLALFVTAYQDSEIMTAARMTAWCEVSR